MPGKTSGILWREHPTFHRAHVGLLKLAKTKMGPTRGPIVRLVAGARYADYMQIDLEPFPLVA